MAWFTSFSPVNMGNALFGDLENDQYFGRVTFAHMSSKLIDYNHAGTARDWIFRGDFNFMGSTTADAEITGGTFRSLTLATSNVVTWTMTNLPSVQMLDALDRASHLDPIGDPTFNPGINIYLLAGSDRIDDQSAGNSVLNGYAGADTILGGTGNDTIDGGTSNDSMVGGAGNDVYFVDSASDQVVEQPGEGTDVVNSAVSYLLPAEVETLVLTGTGNIAGKGNTIANSITGNAGNNLLLGRAGADTLIGGAGNDTLEGAGANDSMNGGAGSDWASFYHANKAVVVDLSLASAATGQVTGMGTDIFISIENLLGSQFNDRLVGDANDNILDGSRGNDTLTGNAGIDTASYASATGAVTVTLATPGADQDTGSAGIDRINSIENLTGGNFNDTLTGNGGDNVLNGGGGTDSLTGGLGIDEFVFSNTTNDVITDFTPGADSIVLDSTVFIPDEDSPGVLLPNELLIGSNVFYYSLTGEQHFAFNTTSGALYYINSSTPIATIYSTGTTPAAVTAADIVFG